MPLVIDNNTRSYESFDVQTASTLYWKTVPALLRLQDREEQSGELTVRILSGLNRNNHNSRILRIHLSNEGDLFFLHTLEVSEEDFQSLKVEQGILVDFANFPGKVITLLERCITSKAQDPPRYQLVLAAKGGDSIFKIVETNDFKQLPHITLAFKPGNDMAIKQFLAFRLSEVKSSCEGLSKELNQTEAQRQATQDQLDSTVQQLGETREQHEKMVLEQQAQAKTKSAIAMEEKMQELAKLKRELEADKERFELKYREQLDNAQQHGQALDHENRQLRQQKYELDTKVSELSHKLGSSEGACRSLEDEVTRLRSRHQQLQRDKAERDGEVQDLRVRLQSAEEKVLAQRDVIGEQNERCRDLEASTRQLEERCSELKEASGGHEARAREEAAEVLKGNRIIEKLTNDLRMAKEKGRRRQAIIARQEEELAVRDRAGEAASAEHTQLQRQLERAQADNKELKDEAASLKSKLEDSRKQLQGNEQMIRWLNNQVNEAQLQFGGTAGGSRYSFKPPASAMGTAPQTSGNSASTVGASAFRPRTHMGTSPPSAAAGSAHYTIRSYTPASGLQTSPVGLSTASGPVKLGSKALTPHVQSSLFQNTPGTLPSS